MPIVDTLAKYQSNYFIRELGEGEQNILIIGTHKLTLGKLSLGVKRAGMFYFSFYAFLLIIFC